MEERQGHRKRVRHYHDPGHVHELTFSCFRRLPLLTNDVWRRMLAESVDVARGCKVLYHRYAPAISRIADNQQPVRRVAGRSRLARRNHTAGQASSGTRAPTLAVPQKGTVIFPFILWGI